MIENECKKFLKMQQLTYYFNSVLSMASSFADDLYES